MLRTTLLAGLAVGALTLSGCAGFFGSPGPTPQAISAQAAALIAPSRPAADLQRDAGRHTADTLLFTRVGPGWKVADLATGGGYFARLFSETVGPEGHVTAWQIGEFLNFGSYATDLKTLDDAYANVSTSEAKAGALDLPDGLDLVFTSQNYHDFHLPMLGEGAAASINAEVFRSLKPGGLYVIIDHSALAGAGLGVANELHRIDIEDVKREVRAAGFVLDGSSDVLANPDDPRTANVFDEGIRGRTDQFMLRFRKPG